MRCEMYRVLLAKEHVAVGEHLLSIVIPCFNAGDVAFATVQALTEQERPVGCELEIVVVDDASTDGTRALLEEGLTGNTRLICPEQNLGRGGAINLGAASAKGDLLLILDCDCRPASKHLFRSHLAAFNGPIDASIGNVSGTDEGFWGRYQSTVGIRRSRCARDAPYMLSTANAMLRATAFRSIGGFDCRYRHYGFEDRDFLLRLHRAGARIIHNGNAVVTHRAELNMSDICRKLHESGRTTAPLFRIDHPGAYRSLGYSALDANLHPVRAAVLAPLATLVLGNCHRIERLLQCEALPYGTRARFARLATGLAFLDGTRREKQSVAFLGP